MGGRTLPWSAWSAWSAWSSVQSMHGSSAVPLRPHVAARPPSPTAAAGKAVVEPPALHRDPTPPRISRSGEMNDTSDHDDPPSILWVGLLFGSSLLVSNWMSSHLRFGRAVGIAACAAVILLILRSRRRRRSGRRASAAGAGRPRGVGPRRVGGLSGPTSKRKTGRSGRAHGGDGGPAADEDSQGVRQRRRCWVGARGALGGCAAMVLLSPRGL